jgi:hypothetical protein
MYFYDSSIMERIVDDMIEEKEFDQYDMKVN